jgi:putative sigma-54 modulation protein
MEVEPFEKLSEKERDEKFPPIVPSNLYLPKPMTVEDAAVELMSGKAPLVVFLNSFTMRVCVLHKNPNGSLGLVETND